VNKLPSDHGLGPESETDTQGDSFQTQEDIDHDLFYVNPNEAVDDDIYVHDDSDIEIDLENLEQNIHHDKDEELPELEPLFPGATVTVGAIMLLLALFVTKHSLVGDGVQQLLQLISLVLPQGHKLCTSLNAFKNYFKNLKNPLVKHYYCGYCFGYIKDSQQEQCPYTKCRKPLNHRRQYFLEMPVKHQLKKLLSQKDFYSNLQGRFSSRQNVYNDIYDGELYKSYFNSDGPLSNPDNISFTFNTDGAAVFKSSNISVWPLFMVINELPYRLRMKKENMILAGLWFGSNKPEMGTYLKPFLDTFIELENGIEMSSPDKESTFTMKAYLLCGTADLPARCILCNGMQYNGSYSCWKCLQPGKTAKVGKKGGHTHVFPFIENQPKQPFRTKDSVLQDSQAALDKLDAGEKKYVTNGVKGPSWLTFFPKFEIVHGIAIDYMHGVLLGVQKTLLSLWFGVSKKGKAFNFCSRVSKVDKRLLGIKPTSSVSRLPRSISQDLRHWKASEYRSFLLFYGAPVLYGILDDQRFAHYLLLVNAVFILLKMGSTEGDISRAENMLFDFVKMFGVLYDKCSITLNFHQLVHLADSVRYLGPLYTHSCFPFEDKNGILLKMIRGTQNIDNQIMTGVSFLQKLPELKQTTIEKGSYLEDFYNSIESPNILKRGLKLTHDIYVLGSIKFRKLTDEEHRAICQCLGYDPALEQYRSFKRIEYQGFLIYGTTYSRMVRRDNSTICYSCENVEMFGKVLFFLLLQTNDQHSGLAVINELRCKNYNPDSNMLSVEKFQTVKAIPLSSITESCINVELPDDPELSFVCRIPNCLESD